MKVSIISGSPRLQSVTIRVAKFLLAYFNEKYPAHQYELINLNEHPVEFVQKVWSTVNDAPEQHKELAQKIFDTDAFVLVTPEYNGSYSIAMKNLLDHFPKQSKKTFGIVTASPGAMGGMRAAQQMQNMICGLFGIPVPNMLVVPAVDKKFDETGKLVDEAFTNSIHTFAQEFSFIAEAIYNAKQK